MIRRYLLRDKVVLITGGSRGLGLSLARELASAGARIVIAARDAAELERAHNELAACGADLLAFPCDITDKAQVEQLARAATDWFGRIDVLVNNAGIIQVGPQSVMHDEDFSNALATHFWGPLWMIRAVLPSMRRNGGGRIVNVSSVGGLVGVPHLAPYCASKFALTGFGEALRAELAKDGIQVINVCPGLMRTGSAWHALFKGRHEREHAWFASAAGLPLLTMSAERAAHRIVKALRRGEARVALGVPAKLLVLLHGLAPGLLAGALELTNRFLPGTVGASAPGEAKLGLVTRPKSLPRWLTILGDRAARKNNELYAAYW
jgi:NAD(P)-dependent dehydrogenase (short-subunit alcohol dehydrogenase family)